MSLRQLAIKGGHGGPPHHKKYFWNIIIRLIGLGLGVWLMWFSPALGQEAKKPPEKPWTGRWADGRVMTRADLDRILREHELWLVSEKKQGQRANLSRAYLKEANLSRASLEEADLSGAILDRANLRADLWHANLSGASLDGANLSGACLSKADLSGAELSKADLSGANLDRADLSGAVLDGADLSGALFEPRELPKAAGLQYLRGLETLRFMGTNSSGLTALRNIFKEAGMRQEERQVNYALQHTRRVNAWEEIEEKAKENKIGLVERGLARLEDIFQSVMFEWTCRWGLEPGRPLQLMFGGIFVFSLPYLLALRSRDSETGIWVLLLADRVLDRDLKGRPVKLSSRRPFRPLPEGKGARFLARLGRGWRLVRLAFYFSLLSAFHLGWRELNVGNWLARLQRREYTLRATGWPRTVAGLQSLLSVFFLALWALTYFGRPFE